MTRFWFPLSLLNLPDIYACFDFEFVLNGRIGFHETGTAIRSKRDGLLVWLKSLVIEVATLKSPRVHAICARP